MIRSLLALVALAVLAGCAPSPIGVQAADLRPAPVVALTDLTRDGAAYELALVVVNHDDRPIQIGVHHVIVMDDANGTYIAPRAALATIQPGGSLPVMISGVLCDDARSVDSVVVALPGHHAAVVRP